MIANSNKNKIIEVINNQEKDIKKTYFQYEKTTRKIANSLKKLDDEQIAAITTLSLITQVALMSKLSGKIDKTTSTKMQKELNAISKKFSIGDHVFGTIAQSRLACFDSQVRYLSAVKNCEDEDRKESECPESWGPASEAMACELKQLEKIIREIRITWGRVRPPMPLPI